MREGERLGKRRVFVPVTHTFDGPRGRCQVGAVLKLTTDREYLTVLHEVTGCSGGLVQNYPKVLL